ncbi:hypothetical protein [Adhaeribacter soli]|uniref:Uncharacterized protein n=1 Tax=Adhaeribacter soli TaxID=2607655 RepID=A0A5N1ITX8_9BACT|nr:hypothetical protein [Adhaeribacter soli]KAA9333544.1 hypothetical protein F0P94_09810 [Adhaeribacter soli]
MKTTLTLLILTCLARLAIAQPTQSARLELKVSNDYTAFSVLPLPDSTLLVLVQEGSLRKKLEPFSLFRYGPDLGLIWQKPVAVAPGSKFIKARTDKQQCYFLFQSQKYNELFLLRVSPDNSRQTITRHKLPQGMGFRFSDFQVLEGQLFLTGMQNDRVVLLHLDTRREELQNLPAFVDQFSSLSEFYADANSQRMEFILSESNGTKARLQTRRLSPDGNLYSLSFLQSPDRSFLNARLSPGDSTQKIIAGTYSLRDLRYAQGFFSGPFMAQSDKKLQYHDFTTFSHFFDYLRPSRQEKLRRKVDRYRSSKKIYPFRQRVLLHNLLPYQKGYLLLGELYQPHYQGEGAGNRMLDGYEFKQAVIMAMDKEGNLLWENSLPLRGPLQNEIRETVTAGAAGNRVFICYPHENRVYYKEMLGSETTPNDKFIEITSLKPGEKIVTTVQDGVSHWFQNNFISYGTQYVRNGSDSRLVFFVNKISF